MPIMNNNFNRQNPIYGVNLVDGWQGAQSFEMIPNQTAVLVDRTSQKPVVFLKSSNEYGMTKSLLAYECKDITGQYINNQNGMPDMSKYATKEEISEIVKSAINELLGGKTNEPNAQSNNGSTSTR